MRFDLSDKMREIPVNEVCSIEIGQVEDIEAGTGCTVFIGRDGMRTGVDVRGGAPASRDSQQLNPLMTNEQIHAIVLGGGSAFGLAASDGVMNCLEEAGIGFDVGVTKVPLVVQSDIFDLTVGDMNVRPDARMGYEAAKIAMTAPNYKDGNYGAGCGATVGKIKGMDTCMKTGIGSFAVAIGDLKIGAVVVLNALGDIYDWKNGMKIAGLRSGDDNGFSDTIEVMRSGIQPKENKFIENTTVSVVMTNAHFTKTKLCKIAGMAHDGYARSIHPVHSSADGDTIYAVSLGEVKADMDLVGSLAAEVVSEAIIRAVDTAESAYGFPCRKDVSRTYTDIGQ